MQDCNCNKNTGEEVPDYSVIGFDQSPRISPPLPLRGFQRCNFPLVLALNTIQQPIKFALSFLCWEINASPLRFIFPSAARLKCAGQRVDALFPQV
jgi:hypothetical protein